MFNFHLQRSMTSFKYSNIKYSLNIIQPGIEIFHMEVFHWRNRSINHCVLQCGGFQLEDEQLFIAYIDISKQAPEAAGGTGKTGG